MAITNRGTKISISNGQIPSGFVPPAIAEFSDFEYEREEVLNVLKATVENVAKETTLLNIIKDAAIGLEKQANDIVTADYINANDVEFYTELTFLSHNISTTKFSDFLNNVSVKYICKVKIFIKTV